MGKNNIENNRPTSPHLQVYKWNMCSFASIMHRLTGIILFASVVLISWYIVAFTYNYDLASDSYDCECLWLKYFEYVVVAAIVAMIFAISYHFANGIRHLFWDIGKGYDIKVAKTTGYASFIFSIVVSVIILALLYFYKFM